MRKFKLEILPVVAIAAIASAECGAGEYSWSGASGGAVGDAANWTPSGVPGAADSVVFRDLGEIAVSETVQNRPFIDELIANAEFTNTKHPDWYTLSVSADGRELLLTCKPRRGMIMIVR